MHQTRAGDAQLYVLPVNGSGEVYHAIRRGDGSWQQFRKVIAYSGYRAVVDISAANLGGEMQVGIIDCTPNGR